ncbi:MAG: hypothetical protein K2I98_01520, partial [Prevotella sp.]|nr:hypothetical protein [Prevotella sp.]
EEIDSQESCSGEEDTSEEGCCKERLKENRILFYCENTANCNIAYDAIIVSRKQCFYIVSVS